MKAWPIATVAVSVVLLAGGAVGAELAPVRAVGAEPAPVRAVGAVRDPVRMGVVLNALDNPFFVAIYEGARAHAGRLEVRATVRSVTSNADLAGQAAQVRALVAARDDCYVVAPITATNLAAALRGVGRPIVLNSPIDPAVASRARVRVGTYIGTDDFAAGRLAGARMASVLPGGGEVALVGGWADNVNSGLRLGGFERGIRGSRLRVVARVNADYDRTTAEIAAERTLRTHPHLAGFFAANDLMALGIADAVRAAGMTGKVRIIGLDGIAEALDAVRAGSMSATVSQYPYVMGQMAVEACAAAGRGARLPARVDAPIALLTKGNVARAIAAFPKPFRPYSDPFSRLLRRRG
ncbi:MAG: sugar transporter substrate-binding protein [Solirubrobacterales bacterium]|nr:sugar transporter substrate-binding protein [Solirubrobacterales bacterium]